MPQIILVLILISCVYALIKVLAIPIIIVIVCLVMFEVVIFIVECCYYESKNFIQLKNSLANNAKNFNELNEHIEELKKAYIDIKSSDNGNASYNDKSRYNYKRPHLKEFVSDKYIHHCSLSVCRNAEIEPFKYFCKYFNVEINEDTLSKFEEVFNKFSAAEDGLILLIKERKEILNSISDKVPFLIYKFRKNKLIKNLGFNDVRINDVFYPKYSFVYISAGGNSKMCTDIEFDTDNLEEFIEYLAEKIKFKKSVKGQRALMTSSLREYILDRDNYTCKQCGLSTNDEPNLLLEIDHIVPVSKGGLTTEDNLQTLCWKCNRSKSNKLIK